MRFTTRILRDRNGNFGILTAILLVPLIGAAGLAVDISQALMLKAQLQNAADAAALAAINEKSSAFTTAIALPADGTYQLDSTEANNIFLSQVPVDLSPPNISASITLKKIGTELTSQVKFTGQKPTTFMNILGQPFVSVGGQASAHYQTPSYLDIYMLVDNTPSMGIGATTADMQLMRNVSGCSLACHVVDGNGIESASAINSYNRDKQAGATIRFDLVTQAISQTINQVKAIQLVSNQVRASAYGFGKIGNATAPVTPPVDTLVNPTTDLDAFVASTGNIKIMTVPNDSYYFGVTDYNFAIKSIGDKITTVGTGLDANNREPTLVIIGDGVSDNYNAPMALCEGKIVNSERCVEPLRMSTCDMIKQRGIKIAVLYTTYTPIPEDSGYVAYIKPFQDRIPTSMSACATPGYYEEVTPSKGIAEAMNALFQKIVAQPRITS